jgi:succinate dehydrogenase / fumarate reductase membrane anchor subunit
MRFVFAGLKAWVWQRLSAVYLLAFLATAAATLLWTGPMAYQDWKDWMGRPAVQVATALFFLMLLVHAWIGLRNVILDYVRPLGLRAALLGLAALALLAQGLWAAHILWGPSAP